MAGGSVSFSGDFTMKLSRKELKRPDEFITLVGRVGAWISANLKEVVIAVCVVISLVGAGIGYSAWRLEKNVEAADAFRKIVQELPSYPPFDEAAESKDPVAPDTTKEEWSKVLSELDAFEKQHGSSSLGGPATLYRGKALLSLGRHDEAKTAYRKGADKLSEPYIFLAKEGEAHVLMEQKKWDEAAKIWKEISANEKNPLREFHLWNLGLTFEGAVDMKNALQIYKDFEAKYSDSSLIEKVRARLALLQLQSDTKPKP